MSYISFQPKDFFTTILHTGTGSAASITGVGFQPDMVWAKQRNGSDNNNIRFIICTFLITKIILYIAELLMIMLEINLKWMRLSLKMHWTKC